jgi:TRAP-type C4-dicarboxylate transport system permease small subunit
MALVVGLMFLTVAHVVGRYLFSFPMLGVVEVSGLIVVTLVFMSAPYDFMIDRHIAVDVVVRRLSPRVKIGVQMGTYFLGLVVVTLAFIWTFKQGARVSQSGATTDILRISLYPFYFVVGFGWLLCTVAVLARMTRFVLEFKGVGK